MSTPTADKVSKCGKPHFGRRRHRRCHHRVNGSEAFANIKRAVLWAARSIPEGKVSTAADIGRAFNIPARHAAYILSQLRPEERELVPVHRVVLKYSTIPKPDERTDMNRSAISLLAREGTEIDSRGRVVGFSARRMIWPDGWAATIGPKRPTAPGTTVE
jgi:alkylated DNA nucleotide flippase Atl1